MSANEWIAVCTGAMAALLLLMLAPLPVARMACVLGTIGAAAVGGAMHGPMHAAICGACAMLCGIALLVHRRRADRAPARPVVDVVVAGHHPALLSLLKRHARPGARLRRLDGPADLVDDLIARRPDIAIVQIPKDDPGAIGVIQALIDTQAGAMEEPSVLVAVLEDPAMRIAMPPSATLHAWPLPPDPRAVEDLLNEVAGRHAQDVRTLTIDRRIVDAQPDYIASRRRLAAELRAALRSGDLARAAAFAHTLLGSPGLHGFEHGIAICRAVEELAVHRRRPAPALLAAVDELVAMFQAPRVR